MDMSVTHLAHRREFYMMFTEVQKGVCRVMQLILGTAVGGVGKGVNRMPLENVVLLKLHSGADDGYGCNEQPRQTTNS